jgi:PelA/Pel-15E family pectate lyase
MSRRVLLLCGLLPVVLFVPAARASVRWNEINRQPRTWYYGPEARTVADSVIQYQTKEGGWPKNTDMTAPPTAEFLANTQFDHRAPTIDNDATTTQLYFLGQVITAVDGPVPHADPLLQAAFERGFDYLLAAQYESGGWPQYHPLRPGYYTHITYNDNAMVNVLRLLREFAAGQPPYAFADEKRRARAAAAVAKGIDCILRTQVKQDGKLTVWCAQHDETTFAPAWARNFEPPTLSGSESVGLVKFLMGVENPSPEIIAAVEGAVKWFEAVPLRGLRVDDSPGADGKRDRHAVADPAAPVIWARFYELGTNKPVFTGRDKIIRYDFNEIERERRAGYAYFGDWPAGLLATDYPRWRAKNKLP